MYFLCAQSGTKLPLTLFFKIVHSKIYYNISATPTLFCEGSFLNIEAPILWTGLDCQNYLAAVVHC